MVIYTECPTCHHKQAAKNIRSKCGELLDKAKPRQRVKGWLTIAVGFYFTWGNELFIQAGLHEISFPIFPKYCAISVKDISVPADINTTAKNIHLISNCTQIKAGRFVEI